MPNQMLYRRGGLTEVRMEKFILWTVSLNDTTTVTHVASSASSASGVRFKACW